MKRLLVILLTFGLVFALTANGAQEGPSEDDSNEPVTVVFWHPFSGATGEAFQSIVDSYNNNRGMKQNITVESVYQGYEGTKKVTLAYQTKDLVNAPDVNVGLTSTVPNMMEMDWSINAEDFLNDPASEISKDTFHEAMQRATTFEGSMVAIPFANSIPLLYYNVDMFSESGYDKAPETMSELAEYIEELTVNNGKEVDRYGLNMQVKRYQLVEFIVSQNENSFFGDNEGGRAAPVTEITAGKDGSLRAFLEKLQILIDTGGYKYIEDDIKSEFAQGLHAMVIMSSSKLGTMDSKMPGRYMTSYLPKVNASDTSGAAIGGSCLNIFDRGDERRLNATWDFIEYIVSPRNQYIFATASGYIPVNVETENLPEMTAYYNDNPQYKVALDQMKDSNPLAQEPMELVYGETNSVITSTMLEFCSGALSIDEAIEQIVTKINAALDEYHEING